MARIQLITIILDILFIAYISRLIIKGKLREEYAIIWCLCTLVLVVFSFWRKGLGVMANLFGVFEPPNLVFTAFIFAILIYLLHLSVVVSKLQNNIRNLSQEIALLKERLDKKENNGDAGNKKNAN
ncbi:DUF2304 domain-containing protein [uncultured Mucilaginibacter sp.]|uniref:DUF2304 domain-containing protein n=1 Tax=uncultured Mucilaginibacter sp. TaxID=797541 RepID=UPI0025E1527E|nr:DUF2304 domain-containing protein [uncultured Mucilaginibacter sp.]